MLARLPLCSFVLLFFFCVETFFCMAGADGRTAYGMDWETCHDGSHVCVRKLKKYLGLLET